MFPLFAKGYNLNSTWVKFSITTANRKSVIVGRLELAKAKARAEVLGEHRSPKKPGQHKWEVRNGRPNRKDETGGRNSPIVEAAIR